MKKLISIVLSLGMLVSVSACSFLPFGNQSNSESESSKDSSSSIEEVEEPLEYTDYKLVENGRSEYTMVLPDEASEGEDWASWELEELFYEATSVTLETVYESDITYSNDAKLIILGDTAYTEEAGVDISTVSRDGYVLKTVGSNLFILGEDYGVLYGVYKFLEKTLHYEHFVMNEYTLDKNVKELYMPDFDYSVAPDFAIRASGWGGNQRTQTVGMFDIFMKSNGVGQIHNSFDFFPQTTYQSQHPEWYADDNKQLCYTAHGDAEEFALMQETLLEKFKQQVNYYFAKGDYKPAINFTMQDNTSWCKCDACKDVLSETGANSTSLIRFINPIAKDFKAWLQTEWPGHEVTIVFFAYYAAEDAPVKEVNGELVPYDDSLVLEDNLAVWVAPLGEAYDYTRSIYSEQNKRMRNLFEQWAVLSQKFYVWVYDTNFNNYLTWYDTFGALQELYQYLRDVGTEYVLNQGQMGATAKTSFDSLKAALNYKLMWNADMNVNAFINRFFDAWYGEASADMKAYYNSYRSWLEYIKAEKNFSGYMSFNGYTTSHYPQEKLNEWMGYINNAYNSIKGLENSNKTRYKELKKRITAESIAVRYMLIRLYANSYSAETLAEMKASFKADAIANGFRLENEWSSIENLWSWWGIA